MAATGSDRTTAPTVPRAGRGAAAQARGTLGVVVQPLGRAPGSGDRALGGLQIPSCFAPRLPALTALPAAVVGTGLRRQPPPPALLPAAQPGPSAPSGSGRRGERRDGRGGGDRAYRQAAGQDGGQEERGEWRPPRPGGGEAGSLPLPRFVAGRRGLPPCRQDPPSSPPCCRTPAFPSVPAARGPPRSAAPVLGASLSVQSLRWRSRSLPRTRVGFPPPDLAAAGGSPSLYPIPCGIPPHSIPLPVIGGCVCVTPCSPSMVLWDPPSQASGTPCPTAQHPEAHPALPLCWGASSTPLPSPLGEGDPHAPPEPGALVVPLGKTPELPYLPPASPSHASTTFCSLSWPLGCGGLAWLHPGGLSGPLGPRRAMGSGR